MLYFVLCHLLYYLINDHSYYLINVLSCIVSNRAPPYQLSIKYIYEHKTFMDTDSYLPPLTVYKLSEFTIAHAQLLSVIRHCLHLARKVFPPPTPPP